jgi:hypothetical protein
MSPTQQDTPLTVNPQAPQQDTPLMVTPMNMPGAAAAQMNRPQETVHAPTEMPVLPNQQELNKKSEDKKPEGDKQPVDVEELQTKYKGVQEIARQFEKAAVENTADAEAFRKLQSLFAGKDGDAQVDPIAEIAKLRGELESERTERLRAEVSRLTGVPPTLIAGSDADSMSASASAALEWSKGLGQKPTGVPVVAPAETVTSADKPGSGRPQQIQTRDQLKGMSSREVMDAYKSGQLDHLLGKPTQ